MQKTVILSVLALLPIMACNPAISPEPNPTTYTVNFVAGSGGVLNGSASQTVAAGGSCTPVTAVPNSGYHFVNWTGDYTGTSNPLTITGVSSDMTITANFESDGSTSHSISGMVTENGSPLEGVVMAFSAGISAVSTNASGQYTQNVPYNWSGTVTPSKTGYRFTPENRVFSNIVAAMRGQDFIASKTSTKRYLKIHYINVQQGESILIEGPDGTTVLCDGGDRGKGADYVVPYLKKIGYSNKINDIIITHRDSDHYKGISEILAAGYSYDHIYDNGSSNAYSDARLNGMSITPMPVGYEIQLGDGAKLTCVTSNGNILGYGFYSNAQNEEDDKSVSLLVQYGKFDYIFTGDLGGGDESCTDHSASQVDVESKLVDAIMPGGSCPLLTSYGVEVMHVGHHGSEGSTNSHYMNMLTPEVACISVGAGQSNNKCQPRKDVVENVLMALASCVTAPPALVLQTEEGAPLCAGTSTAGFCVGDIIFSTDGEANFQVEADGNVYQGPDERAAAALPRTYPMEE